MRCKTCHYSLTGLTERGGHRCPECGTPFNPNTPETFLTDREVWGERKLPWMIAAWIAMPLAILVLHFMDIHETSTHAIVIGLVIAAQLAILVWPYRSKS